MLAIIMETPPPVMVNLADESGSDGYDTEEDKRNRLSSSAANSRKRKATKNTNKSSASNGSKKSKRSAKVLEKPSSLRKLKYQSHWEKMAELKGKIYYL